MNLESDCPICGGPTTTSVCSTCAENLEFLGLTPPHPDATREQVMDYVKEHKISSFRCGVKK